MYRFNLTEKQAKRGKTALHDIDYRCSNERNENNLNQVINFRDQPLVVTHSLELLASSNKDVNFDFEKQLDIKAKHHHSGREGIPS